ncbi:MAG: YigZ family protein [Firmicutes bacterium]|nr:YigZ family protein [Bacillota bacterium]
MELYKTVQKEATETQIIEKSKFIAHIKPVENREEAEAFIDEIKQRYKDATHNVPAMVIGDGFQVQWASDDGEPQGTSGAPIVQMLVKEGITNVAAVVTRYFGGIKLGTGGLVRAYTSSVKLGLEAAGICSVYDGFSMEAEIDYSFLAVLQKLEGESFTIEKLQYGEKVTAEILCMKDKEDEVKRMISNITSGKAVIRNEKNVAVKVPEK